MKRLFYFFLMALMVCAAVSCTKDGKDPSGKIITVKSGEDLQSVIDQAEGPVEIRVEADAVFAGTITLHDGIRLSGASKRRLAIS